ncbi:metal ABC transporter permease [Calycomorphotria hydatis]|uniref:Manganese transport system membrane protein MntB n=1 Tax=Calycomorphotria hydatis TaxID=2528027 RepID=A0A517T525_9PLAN|nr:metal ABC transporter permease [Calycomorphotria hydatis]QDT63477.1 Manganese transport system membrane protein MntB [Calycomorphotria hydatis]
MMAAIALHLCAAVTTNFSDRLLRLLTLSDYNTRVVLAGTMLLGVAAGAVGVFLVLRKRALIGDVIGHAALPGIGIAFLVGESIQAGLGRSMPLLLLGAAITGTLGAIAITLITRHSRVKDDAAMALVLGVFFGGGSVLFSAIQRIPGTNAAGLNHLLFGKTASLLAGDVTLFAIAAGIILLVTLLLQKELTLLCFDPEFLAASGRSVLLLDFVLMALTIVVSVIGIQSVGLVLVVAALIIPATAARFWTDHAGRMLILSATFGGLGAGVGVMGSALFPSLAAGGMIIVANAAFFAVSLAFGTRHGLWQRWYRNRHAKREAEVEHLLRAFYEIQEAAKREDAISLDELVAKRSWSGGAVAVIAGRCTREGLLQQVDSTHWKLTPHGKKEAARVTRNHRLWEIYLMKNADAGTHQVDRAADRIEHVLGPELVAELEASLTASSSIPPSPHPLNNEP